MADNLPFEYQSQIVANERRKQLAEALQKQAFGFQGAQQTGRIAPKTSPLTWLANTATGYLASEGAGKAEEKQAAIRAEADKARQAEMLALLQAPEEQQQALGVQGKFPQTQTLAGELFKRKQDKIKAVAELLKDRDPNRAVQAQLSGALPGADYQVPGIKPAEEGRLTDGTPFVRDYNLKGEGTTRINRPPTQINTGTTQETAAAKAVGGKIPEVFEGITGSAKNAIGVMESADRIEALLKNPATITGFGAGVLEGLAGLGAAMGFQGPDAAAKTQGLLSELAAQTLANVKKLPGAITEKERPFLELASSGRIEFTSDAIQRLADISRMASHNALLSLKTEYTGAAQSPGAIETGAPGIWPFPRGWNFSADPAKYMETGTGTNRYRYIGDTPKPAAPKAWKKPDGWDALTPQQQARYMQLKGIKE